MFKNFTFKENNYPKNFNLLDLLTLNDVYNLYLKSIETKDKIQPYKNYALKIVGTSKRLLTFYKIFKEKQEISCYCCGKRATHFALIQKSDVNYKTHSGTLELVGVDKNNNEMILFTHDHVVARSKNGEDNLTNTLPMCFDCNQLKSSLFENNKSHKNLPENFLEILRNHIETNKE